MSLPVALQKRGWTEEGLGRLSWAGLSIFGAAVLLAVFQVRGPGYDFYAYWNVDPGHPYVIAVDFGSFRYPPPVAWPAPVLHLFPFDLARIGWLALDAVILVWLTGRWALAWCAFLPVSSELFHGNVHLVMAGLLAAGWSSFLPLAKPSTIVVALADLALGRGRIALRVVLALVAVSLVLQPATWIDWFRLVLEIPPESGGNARIAIPLVARMIVATALSFAAWRWRTPWLLAPALALSLPIMWIHGLSVLTAIPRLRRAATHA